MFGLLLFYISKLSDSSINFFHLTQSMKKHTWNPTTSIHAYRDNITESKHTQKITIITATKIKFLINMCILKV